MATYNFINKSVPEITAAFIAIIDNDGAASEIDDAFLALDGIDADIRSRVAGVVEEFVIRQAKLDGAAWHQQMMNDEVTKYSFHPSGDEQYQDEKRALLNDLERLRAMAAVLPQVSRIKPGDVERWTSLFTEEYSRLPAEKKNDIERLAECFAAVFDKVTNAGPSSRPLKAFPNPAVGDVIDIVRYLGADAAIAGLEGCDSDTRKRLLDGCAEYIAGRIAAGAALASMQGETGVAMSTIQSLRENTAFTKYVIEARHADRGAAAHPLMKAYIEIAPDMLAAKQPGDKLDLSPLFAAAVSRLTAAAHRHKLKELAGRKVPNIKSTPGF